MTKVRLFFEPEAFWVDPVMAFANHDDIDPDLDEAGFDNLWRDFFSQIPEAKQFVVFWKDVAQEQARLRDLLKLMISGRQKARLRQLLAETFDFVHMKSVASMSRDGKIVVSTTVGFSHIAQWYSAALAALIDASMENRVRRCRDPNCKRFFVDWPRPGRPMAYCSTLHQDRHNKEINR